MVTDQLRYSTLCLLAGLLGVIRPQIALVLYRVSRGRSANPDAHSPVGVRIVSGLLALVGVVGVITGV